MRIKQVFLVTCLSLMPVTWHHIPVLRLLLPLLFGVCFAMYFPVDIQKTLGAGIITCCALVFISRSKTITQQIKWQWVFGAVLHISLFMFGNVLLMLHIPVQQSDYFMHDADSSSVFLCRLTMPPTAGERSIRLDVAVQERYDHNRIQNVSGKSIIYLRKDSTQSMQLSYGDLVYVSNIFQEPDPPKNPHAFDFAKYLKQQKVYHIAFASPADLMRTDINDAKWQWQTIYGARTYFHNILSVYFKDEHIKSIGEAMVIGSRTDIDDHMRQAYANTGTMHILAVSGLHVGILFAVIAFLLRPVSWLHKNKYGRIVMCLLLLVIIWWYACLAGLSASVNRSAVMFSFLSLGKLWERESNTFNVLFASMFVLILSDPFCITQAGFQLSYLAVGGILFFQPFFMRLYRPRLRVFRYVYELLTVSISAQLATLPVSLLYFHQFPNYFLLSNLLAIPVSFVVLIAGLTLFAFGGISLIAPYIAAVFGWSMQLMNGSILAVDALPYSVTDNMYFSVSTLIFAYAAIFVFGGWLALRKSQWAIATLIFLLFLLLDIQVHHIRQDSAKRMVIYTTKQNPMMSYQSHRETILLADTLPIIYTDEYRFSVRSDLIAHGGAPDREISLLDTLGTYGDGWAVHFPWVALGEELLFVLHPDALPLLPELAPEVDYLYIIGNPFLNLADLRQRFPNAVLVPDNSCSYRRKQYYASAGAKIGFSVYTFDHSGAFIIEN